MSRVTFPDGTVHNITKQNVSSEFNSYVSIARGQGQTVDLAAQSQAFDVLAGTTQGNNVLNPNQPVSAIDQATLDNPLYSASDSIFTSAPTGVQSIWQTAADSTRNAASSATSFATTETSKLASAIGNAIPGLETTSEFIAVAVVAAAVFGVAYLLYRGVGL